MLTQKEITNLLKNAKTINSGNVKVFVRINSSIAIKLCENKENRDNNYFYQELASMVGLGPDVYGKFEIKIFNKTLYGYYTEIVKTFSSHSDFAKKYQNHNIDELGDKLKNEINYSSNDIFYGNVGEKDGRLVCIDFDTIECYNHNAKMIINLIKDL